MRELPCNSTDHGFSEPPPIFPYRPRPKNGRRSPGLQRKSHVPDAARKSVGHAQGSARRTGRASKFAQPCFCREALLVSGPFDDIALGQL